MPGAIVSLILAGGLLLGGAAADVAPKFVSTDVSSDNLEVEIRWKETGLWPKAEIRNSITAEARATYVCVGGGDETSPDHQNVSDLVSSEGDFTANDRGISSGQLSLKPPGPGMYSCSPGQELKLACVNYAALRCKDERYAISSDLRRTIVLFQPGYSQFCDLDLR